MPTDACQHFYRCQGCGTLLKPLAGDCCVFCSYSDHVCPPKYRRRQMNDARAAVRLCSRARVVGVAFWDSKHNQTGVAPNAIELHPILGFACLSG
jgi:hypothetical protein